MMIFIKFLTYFVYKSKKIYNAYHIRKDKINESIKDGIENPGDTRRYSWFLGTTLRREEVNFGFKLKSSTKLNNSVLSHLSLWLV